MTTSTKIKVRWSAVVTVLVALVVGAVIGMGVQFAIDHEPAPAAQSQGSSDPWHGVPSCTDEIADAGGICHGEPTAEPNGLADTAPLIEAVVTAADWRAGYVPCETPTGSTMTVGCYWDQDGEHYVVTDDGEKFDVDPATGERTYVPWEVNEDPWLTTADGTRHFEDGSWLALDGTSGCTAGMPCDQLPPVPAGEPTTPDGGYYPTLNLRPCLNEDSEDCYWDAARMGNQQGTSFIRVGGVTYYPEGAR